MANIDSPIAEIRSLLTSPQLLILRSSYNELRHLYNPENVNLLKQADFKNYKDQVSQDLALITQNDDAEKYIFTTDYNSTEIPDGSLAFHEILGSIVSDSRWWFSTLQFERDIKAAEANPNICAHFLFIKSPGGEAYYLDELSKTLKSCTKPLYVFIRQMCASAAYYIACHGTVVKANTANDIIGSIGTKVSFLDWDSYDEKQGLRRVEYYATNSQLKDRKYKGLIEGKGKEKLFIETELDPLNIQFMNTVRSCRKKIAAMDYDNPVLQGETFRAEIAMTPEVGLIDGIISFDEAIIEAKQLAHTYMQKRNDQRKRITTFL